MPKDRLKILRVPFDKVTLKEATQISIDWAKGNKQRQITTPNPEFLLEAGRNGKFLKVLNTADLNIADGTGILWGLKFKEITKHTHHNNYIRLKWLFSLLSVVFWPKYIRTVLPERVTGVDLMQEICRICPKEKLKVFLLGGWHDAAIKAKTLLEKKNPGLNVVGTYEGTPKIEDEKKIITQINKVKPDILFVAYGAPNQDLWIARNQKKMPSVKVALGIGGSFNFVAGKKKRAPKFLQKLGLEWLFRLIQEPSRFKRIYNATIKFPRRVLTKRLN
jgi:N-acetylglucosaminyldiphosphoundecaprenol N-acetyl-beta-D-mannosaminyltransferase